MTEDRGRWYLLTGFVIGAVLGLVYAWLISPQQTPDTPPASLQPEFKDQFRAMIAAAFVATGNLPRAEARLALLGESDSVIALSEQAQRTLGEGGSPIEAQALGLLAVALGQDEAAALPTQIFSPTPTEVQNTNPMSLPSRLPPNRPHSLQTRHPRRRVRSSPRPPRCPPVLLRQHLVRLSFYRAILLSVTRTCPIP